MIIPLHFSIIQLDQVTKQTQRAVQYSLLHMDSQKCHPNHATPHSDRTNQNCALLPPGIDPGPSEPQSSVYTTAPRCLAMAGPVYWADHMHWITNRPIMRRQAVCAVWCFVWCSMVRVNETHIMVCFQWSTELIVMIHEGT